MQIKELKPGEYLFREGDPGDEMYLIQSGRIKVTKGEGDEERVLAILKEGDFFGEMAVIDGSPRSANAIAIDHVRLTVIDREAFKRQLQENPVIAYVVEVLIKRLRATDEKVKLLSIKMPERRVVSYLLTKAKENVSPIKLEDIIITTSVKQNEVRKVIEDLLSQEIVSLDKDKIVVKDIKKLEKYHEYLKLKEEFEEKSKE